MSEEVVIERVVAEDSWERVGSISKNEPPGSFSNEEPEGRQVYLFGWFDNDGPAVWRSVKGFDIANDAVRELHTDGLEKVADLREGLHRMQWRREQLGELVVRFRAIWV